MVDQELLLEVFGDRCCVDAVITRALRKIARGAGMGKGQGATSA